ncbi:MAG: M67 family metallopeptidase [Acidimicrobiales bacterium]
MADDATFEAVLTLTESVHAEMVAHCLDGLPEEACGLLGGTAGRGPGPDGVAAAVACYPARNEAASARIYTLHPLDHLRADRDAEGRGLALVGVFHSHTHTDAYPSPTDVAQAPDPDWHYVIVSLRHPEPAVRSYRIVDGAVTEEPVVIVEQ